MDRRQQASTDDMVHSVADSIKDLTLTSFQLAKDYVISSEELKAAKPEQILSRMLSTKSYISTSSSLAERSNAAQDDISLQRFQEIGKGQCGTIFALSGSKYVAKVPNSAEKVAQLVSEFKMHTGIIEALCEAESTCQTDINITKLEKWVCPDSKGFLSSQDLRFPPNVNAQSFAMVSSRIFPIPLPVREALVDVLCSSTIRKQKEEFLAKPENQNCLIRLYLGRRETNKAKKSVKLQNFPLHVNEMESLHLDTTLFAQVMAQTLAILHWKAGIDGNDIEFILGSSPLPQGPTLNEIRDDDEWSLAKHFEQYDFGRRSVSMWLIDFNQCATFEDNEAGLKKLVDAFFWNDPYFPRPGSTQPRDQELWDTFRKRYIVTSRLLTESATPERFIAKVEEQSQKGTVGGLF